MKNILLISVSAPPKSGAESIQSGRFLKYLREEFEIYLITSSIERKGWKKIDHTLSTYGENIKKRVEIPVFSNMISRFARYNVLPIKWLYPDPDFLFHYFGMWKLKWIKSIRPDLIYSRSMPLSSAFLAYKIKEKLNIPWVMHLSDPWAENPYRDIRYVPKDLKWEQKAFEKADIITLTSENAVSFYQKRYPDLSSKILYFPNVYDEVIENSESTFKGKLRIVFTGNLYEKRTLLPFFLSLAKVIERFDNLDEILEIRLAGNFDQNNLKTLSNYNFSFIKYLGPVTLEESINLQKSADVLLSTDKRYESEIDEVFFLCKILDYLAARKLIIALTDYKSPIFNIINNKSGKCFNFNEADKLSNYLIEIIIAYQNKQSSFFRVDPPPDFFSARTQSKRLKSVFDSLV